jgi:hypothetical protein
MDEGLSRWRPFWDQARAGRGRDAVFSGKSYYFCCGLQNHTGRPFAAPLRLYAAMDGKFGAGTPVFVSNFHWHPFSERDMIDRERTPYYNDGVVSGE